MIILKQPFKTALKWDKDFEMVDQWNEGGGLYYF